MSANRKCLILFTFCLLNTTQITTLENSELDFQIIRQETKMAFQEALARMERNFEKRIILQEQINLQLENALWREIISLETIKNELLEFKKELELRATNIFLQNNSTDLIGKIIELGLSGASIFDKFYPRKKLTSEKSQ